MKTIRTILATFGVTTLLYGLFALLMMRLNPAFTGRSIFQLFRETGFITLVIGIGCVLAAVIMTIAIVSFRDEGSRKKHESFDEEDELDEFLEDETVPEERAAEADETWSSEIKRKQRKALRHTDEDDEEEGAYEYYQEDGPEPQSVPIRQAYGEQKRVQPSTRAAYREERSAQERTRAAYREERPEQEPTRAAYREERPEQEPTRAAYRGEPEAPAQKPVIRSSFHNAGEKAPSSFRPAGSMEDDRMERPASREKRDAYPAPEAASQMHCPYCGELIDSDSTFCIYCGKRV